MRPLPPTRELLRLAERLLPAKHPQDVLDHPQELLARAAEFGNDEDVALLVDYVGEDALREADSPLLKADPSAKSRRDAQS